MVGIYNKVFTTVHSMEVPYLSHYGPYVQTTVNFGSSHNDHIVQISGYTAISGVYMSV